MDQPEVKVEDFLHEIGFGEVRMTIVEGKLLLVPKQIVRKPIKYGIRIAIVIREPIRLKYT